jgi:hypothetical protein
MSIDESLKMYENANIDIVKNNKIKLKYLDSRSKSTIKPQIERMNQIYASIQ